jgi:diguanylate cyclase (GGDEF)-like protein
MDKKQSTDTDTPTNENNPTFVSAIWKLTIAPIAIIIISLTVMVLSQISRNELTLVRILPIILGAIILTTAIIMLTRSLIKRLRGINALLPLLGESQFSEVRKALAPSINKSIKRNTASEVDQIERSLLDLSHKMEHQDENIDFHNKEIERMSLFDSLTGLVNRHLFLYETQNDLLDVQDNKRENIVAVIFLDLDKFKRINDSLGHQVGDLLLKKMGKRLRKATQKIGMVGRPGGDEFSILLRNIRSVRQLNTLCEKLQKLISQPIMLADTSIVVSCSIGIAASVSNSTKATDLVRHAEIAMYKAKDAGGGTYRLFTPSMASEAQDSLLLESDIRRAFTEKEFTLYLQPKVDTDNKIQSFESLVRWDHPKKGLLAPGLFIAAMESMGFISQLDDWILETSCRQLKILMEHYPGLSIAVNISSTRFSEESFVNFLQSCIEKYGIEPEHLELEITETMLMENMATATTILNKIKQMGIKIAIDDFGTGYSSLSYLKDLSVDTIKIDQAFIRDIPENEKDMQICSVIIYLAKQLKYKVVAEGVETKEQMDFLVASDCDLMQGYLFSKPIPAHKVLLMLETERLMNNSVPTKHSSFEDFQPAEPTEKSSYSTSD